MVFSSLGPTSFIKWRCGHTYNAASLLDVNIFAFCPPRPALNQGPLWGMCMQTSFPGCVIWPIPSLSPSGVKIWSWPFWTKADLLWEVRLAQVSLVSILRVSFPSVLWRGVLSSKKLSSWSYHTSLPNIADSPSEDSRVGHRSPVWS